MAEPKILYEDSELVVVDKPAGMVVLRVATSREPTVQDWVESQSWWKGGEDEFLDRSGIAHRLDKETSGCLAIAKNPETLQKLMKMFKDREIHKEYVAVVHGRMEPAEGSIRLPIGRVKNDGRKRGIVLTGKAAETRWKVEKHFDDKSLVRLWPKTGRTHQLRVHLAHLGHPIVGDMLYLNERQRVEDRESMGRHLLHAEAIEFMHPTRGELIRVVSPMESQFGL